ncbi:serine carboxypeptidase-like 26 [Papaver somniferum]|uniref:serine carboxypeptidase-like 26 n=1 Tax=Papaver somniferum TaxID=3469 RepID=UPI000E6FA4EA|nr:serine carboxypeptidase-like 26 [Papaver somniferum]
MTLKIKVDAWVILQLSVLFFLSYCSCFIESQQQQESDRVINPLPGQPSSGTNISHFSGYITVNEDHGRALFYWFFEAQTQPSEKPLLLWLNGGPGCSSIGYGAAIELGPLRVNQKGDGLDFNSFSWNKEANLLFVESPVGVGFSYTNTSSDLTQLNDEFVAEDAYIFVVNWLERFPQFKSHDFFLSGESYAGHYVPQLADLIYTRNSDTQNYPLVNLKGFLVGNPETDDFYDSRGLLEYAWSHAVISNQVYDQASIACDFKHLDWPVDCQKAMNLVFKEYKKIDIYNIYAPTCLKNKTSALAEDLVEKAHHSGLSRMRIFGGYDPCFSTYTEEYFNTADVQSALHAKTGKWKVCNNSILYTYNFTVFSILPIYTKLIKAGLKIWIYSGDTDGRVPVIGSRYWTEALGLSLKSPWRTWYHENQVGGRIVEYENGFSFVTVKGAGHLVPLNKPTESLALIRSFLSGDPLPDNTET